MIWSRDLGEKKSDLIDALSQLRVDEDSLARISKAAAEGSVPERVLRDAERKVEADRIAVSRAVRTLQSWRISKEEIDQVRAEAESALAREDGQDREEMVAQWAKLEVLAPLDGTVIERNVALGDLVDTNIDLFKVADLSRLRVVAHAYEEDLPSLDALKNDRREWTVAVGSGPDAATRTGQFDQVGCIIDPNQHTALVMGWVDNRDGQLRVGQFVTVRLEVPPPKSEVVVPAAALCEEGGPDNDICPSPGHPGLRSPPGRRLASLRQQGLSPQPSHDGRAAARVGATRSRSACGNITDRAIDGQFERIEVCQQIRSRQVRGRKSRTRQARGISYLLKLPPCRPLRASGLTLYD